MKKFVLINSPLFWERTDEEEKYLSPSYNKFCKQDIRLVYKTYFSFYN